MWYIIRAVDPVDNKTYYWSGTEWVRSIDDASMFAPGTGEATRALAHVVKWYSHSMTWFQIMSA